MKLTVKQTKALDYLEDNVTNEVLYGGGAGGGKSILGDYWLTKCAFRYPGTRWLMGRSILKTLKETTLNSFFEVCRLQNIPRDAWQYKEQKGSISFYNGSEILLKGLEFVPSDPNFDELGSLEITGAFIDECNQVVLKCWNIVKSRIRYRLDEYDLVPKILGCCNPAKNFVYTRFYKPHRNGELPGNMQFIQSLATDNKFLSKHYIDNLNGLDYVSKQRLLHGNWEYDDDPSVLMVYDNITNLFSNEFVLPMGEKFITADIARKGKDKTVIGVWHGYRLIDIVELSGKLTTEVANVIRQLMTKYGIPANRVICDEDGVGGGVVDMLRCKGFVNGATPFIENGKAPNYENLRAQCYFKLSNMVNADKLFLAKTSIEQRERIIKELEQIREKDIDKDGRKKVINRAELIQILGYSPDYASMLMMRMYFEVAPRTGRAIYNW